MRDGSSNFIVDRLKTGKGKRRARGSFPPRPFPSLARWSAVYPSLRAIRLRYSRDFLLFVSFRSAAAVVAHHHPRPRIAAAVIYRFATRLKARDNKGRGKRVPWTTSSSLPIAASVVHACILARLRGGWLPGVGSQNTSVGFWRCGMLPSYLEYWIRGRKDCSSIRE